MRLSYKSILCLLLVFSLALGLTACGAGKQVTEEFTAMNALIDITAYGSHAEKGVVDAKSAFTSMEALLDPELETSKIYAINHADGATVTVNAQIAGMIQTAQKVSESTDGALDITLYPLVKAWGFVGDQFSVPDDATIDALLQNTGMDNLGRMTVKGLFSFMLHFSRKSSIFCAMYCGVHSEYSCSIHV